MPRRSRFGPVVLVGVATAAAAAWAGSRPWAVAEEAGGDRDQALGGAIAATADASAPPVTALALVLLACWGVLLVTRGRFRRVVAGLAVLAAVGVTAFAVAGLVAAPDVLARTVATDLDLGRTAWGYLGVGAGVLGALAALVAVREVPGWPEMGRRYDAPTGSAADAAAAPPEDQTNLDLWKAIDEGRDPTDPDG